jgi:hypothetical protein
LALTAMPDGAPDLWRFVPVFFVIKINGFVLQIE